jgi:seryl-tRNA synthetase
MQKIALQSVKDEKSSPNEDNEQRFLLTLRIITKKTKNMLTLKQLRDDKELAIARLAKKGVDAAPIIAKIEELDDKRKAIQVELDNCLAEQNKAAKQIGMLMGQGKRDEAEAMKQQVAALKARSVELSADHQKAQDELQAQIVLLPNFPAEIVPEGRTAEDNVVVKLVENYSELPENPLPHWELASKYDIIDFDLGVKLTGAGFPVYKGKGARLQRALINYFLDCNTEAGYQEVEVPVMVNEASGFGTGQLPDKEGQMYHATADNFYLVPTAEVPVTNIFRDVILDEKEFPVKMTAYTPCFRREAGSYGKDVRGLNRLHQFDKVEIVQLALPENSYEALDGMVAHVEKIVASLGLPYRILRLCGGDMSFTSALTYDFEVYSEAQKRWLEVSSVSNFESFQANRLKLRYRDANKKTQLAHTLNGSSLALPRIVAALLENNQTAEGIRIPEVLVPYTGFDIIK